MNKIGYSFPQRKAMIFKLVILVWLASIAAAATTVADLPKCALGCYAQGVGNTTCSLSDAYANCLFKTCAMS